MLNNKICEKCASNKIIQGVKIIDYSHGNIKINLSLEIDNNECFLNKKSLKSEILCNVCESCGNVELNVLNFEKLWNIYINLK